jgi:hypothetical protein
MYMQGGMPNLPTCQSVSCSWPESWAAATLGDSILWDCLSLTSKK